MALSPSNFLTSQDMEDFAQDYLGLSGVDSDMYYESYYNLKNDGYDDDDEYRVQDELHQTKYEYWNRGGFNPPF